MQNLAVGFGDCCATGSNVETMRGADVMIIDHDIHIHTNLSACSKDDKAVPENIIRRAAENGLKVIGFANHFWDSKIPGASQWYAPQNMDHIMKIRRQIPEDTMGVRVLIGCESEYCGDGKAGISRETAGLLDFVLLPMSHLHMKGFVEPLWVNGPDDVARLMVRRFNEVVGLGIATGIAHPFVPVHYKNTDEIISRITDAEFEECFGRAADAGISIEIQANYFPGISRKQLDGYEWSDETFMRVLSIAKRSGCCFHFGSDAHCLDDVGSLYMLDNYILELGITEKDILQFNPENL